MMGVGELFLENGDDLIFEDKHHLETFLEYVFSGSNAWVPPSRTNGRTAAHRERYCLRYFLAKDAARFVFPLSVEKTERPDFLITDGAGRSIGVEHTDAGPEAYQRWLAHVDGRNGGGELPESFDAARSHEDAAADVVAALRHKSASINKYGYQEADDYVLLIYLLTNAALYSDGDFERVLALLPPFEDVAKGRKRFDRALIILGNDARYWA